MSNDLPADIVEKILYKLPVKAVLRCQLLQKSYYSLINSKAFIHAYNREAHSNPTTSPLIFITRFTDQTGDEKLSLRYYDSELKESTLLYFPFQDNFMYEVISCCKSLVCLFHYISNKLILWNPYIQKCLILPQPNSSIDRCNLFGLGFDDESSDYKVLMITEKYQVELYSLEHNSWKIIADNAPQYPWVYTAQAVSVKGSLYWISTSPNTKKCVVGVFDLKHQVFSEIGLPKGWDILGLHGFSLKTYGDSSIAVVDYYCLRFPFSEGVQVMDVGGKEKKWKKLTRACVLRGEVRGFRKNEETVYSNIAFHKRHIYDYVESLALYKRF